MENMNLGGDKGQTDFFQQISLAYVPTATDRL